MTGKQEFEIILHPEEEGGYSVSVPELPGCWTQGETREEAIEMAKEAIEGHIETLTELGQPLPQIERTRVTIAAMDAAGVHIDTSAYIARRYPPELVRYLRGGGRKKVLFGTNYPMILPEKALEDLDALELDDEARDLFLAGNAQRVFNLPASA